MPNNPIPAYQMRTDEQPAEVVRMPVDEARQRLHWLARHGFRPDTLAVLRAPVGAPLPD